MSLYRYASESGYLAEELIESLTSSDVDALRDDCEAMGMDGWLAWRHKYAEHVDAFAKATPSRRASKKAWRDPVLKRRLVLASIHCMRKAEYLLNGLTQHPIEPGGSYRETAVEASEVYDDVFRKGFPEDWPFGGPDPLDDS